MTALISALAARAQELPPDVPQAPSEGGPVERLPEVLVTAPPAAETAGGPADPTAFAAVIDTASAPTRVVTLEDFLADSAGVQVRRFGGLGAFSTVSVRGFSPAQVQVYLDGVPLSRADNEVVNLADLPVDAVERVEVYRGTTPLAFAQSGPGGVVNIVTRRPGAVPLTAASASYGSFQTRKVDVARSATHGPWSYLAFGHYLGSAGDFTFVNDLGTTDQPADDRTERRINNDFNLGSLTGRVGWSPPGQPVSLALTTDSFGNDQGVPGRGSVQSPDARRHVVRQLAHVDATLEPRTGLPLVVESGAYFLYQQQQFTAPVGDPAFAPTDVTDRTLAGGGQAVVRAQLGPHHVPGLLLAVSDEQLVETDGVGQFPASRPGESPPRTRLRGTVAGEDEILLFGERVSVLPGLRWEGFRDDFPNDPRVRASLQTGGSETRHVLSPRLGVRAEVLPHLTLLGNAGRYTRVPNLEELFGNSGIVRGNPDLQPEVTLNWDAGFRLAAPGLPEPIEDAGLEFAYFDNRVDDLIVLVPSSVNVFRPENIASARVRGQELSLRSRFWRRLALTANYTHQNAREESDVAFRNGKQIPGRPAHEAYVRLELGWDGARPLPLLHAAQPWPGRVWYELDLIADNFLDRANTQLVPSRDLHSVGVEVTLPIADVRLAVEVRNLTDDQTRDALDFPLPGRSWFVTLSWGFGAPRAGGG